MPPVDADVLVLAGDIGVKKQGLEFALSKSMIPAIYVAGNHEYYGSALPKLSDELAQLAAETHVRFPRKPCADHRGYAFFGMHHVVRFRDHGQYDR